MIVWRLRGNIIRTALCWIVCDNVYSPQHTYVSSSYRSNRLGLSYWDPYAVRRGGCLELYYCNMVEWFWWDSSLILTTNWFSSVLRHCWFGYLACKNRPRNDVSSGTLNPTHSLIRKLEPEQDRQTRRQMQLTAHHRDAFAVVKIRQHPDWRARC